MVSTIAINREEMYRSLRETSTSIHIQDRTNAPQLHFVRFGGATVLAGCEIDLLTSAIVPIGYEGVFGKNESIWFQLIGYFPAIMIESPRRIGTARFLTLMLLINVPLVLKSLNIS